MKKSNLEFRVGIFVIVAVALLLTLVFRAGDFTMKPGYSIRVLFEAVSGIERGSLVCLAGVRVGDVTDIRVVRSLEGLTQVEATLRIAQGIYIEDDADVRIGTLGMLGEKYIEIHPGTTGNPTLGDGATIRGKPPVHLQKITESGSRLLDKLEFTVDNLNEVVADPKFKASVKGTFAEGSQAAANLKETTEDLRDAAKSARIVLGRLRDGEGTIGRLLQDDKIARDLEDFVKDLKAHPWKLLKKS